MPIGLNNTPQPGFDQPIQLLMDCHRRIERFLGMLIRVTEERRGRTLDAQYREAAEAALRYFRNAAPWHTRDEEDSLFPRLRELNEPRVEAALASVAQLESEHEVAEAGHRRVDELMNRWLSNDQLAAPAVEELLAQLHELRHAYQRHITEEDDVIFPLAAEVLDDHALEQIGREMAQRRGIAPQQPQPRCKHAKANRSAGVETDPAG